MLRHAKYILLPALMAGPVWAVDLPLPQGAVSLISETEQPGSYDLPVAPFDGVRVPSEPAEGQVTREVWRVDSESITNLQIIDPIRKTLGKENFDIILDCASVACGGFEFRFGIEVLPPPEMYVDLTDFRVLSARGEEGALSVLVSGSGVARFVQVIRVGDSAAAGITTAVAPVAPVIVSDLASTLETSGHVVLDDLQFETGSSTLSAGPYATLKALSDYLLSNASREIALVGHTDAVGGLEGNIALSRRRAEAVMDRLSTTYGVPRDQMEAGGMGYLAPRTNNLTDEGRAANRRVEAVLTSTE